MAEHVPVFIQDLFAYINLWSGNYFVDILVAKDVNKLWMVICMLTLILVIVCIWNIVMTRITIVQTT